MSGPVGAPADAPVSLSRTGLPSQAVSSPSRLARSVVGGFFLSMGGVHLGIVAADARFYRHFADHALFSFVRHGWTDVFMATPVFWGLCLVLGETLLGTCLLVPLARKDWPRLAGEENVR